MDGNDASADDEVLRIEAVAARWNCSGGGIREMLRAGELPTVRRGIVRGVPLAAVIAFEAEHPERILAAAQKSRRRKQH